MAQEAFRHFTIDSPFIAQTIKAHVEQRIGELSAPIAQGYAKDWPDYMKRIGQIEGLRMAVQICEDHELKERK